MYERTLTPARIGAIVRAVRKDSGLRQDELAGATGVGVRFIVELEAGKPTAQLGKVLRVLQALGCSFDIAPPPGTLVPDAALPPWTVAPEAAPAPPDAAFGSLHEPGRSFDDTPPPETGERQDR